MDSNSGAALPVQSNARWYKILSPRRAEVIKGTLLGDRYHGEWTHWVRTGPTMGRTVRCTNDEKCFHCYSGEGNRWSGYIAFKDALTKDRYVLSLSELAARKLKAIYEKRGTLRGLAIETWRKNPKQVNAPQMINVTGEHEGPLMEAHSIYDSIARVFGVNGKYLENIYKERQNGFGAPMPYREPDDGRERE